MPRKKFEETPYDPIAADLMREVASGAGRAIPAPLAMLSQQATVVPMPPQPAPPVEIVTPSHPPPGPALTYPEPTITKRVVLTRSENEELESFLLRLQKRAGVKLTMSMFARATLNVAMQAEEQLLAEVEGGAPRRFPSTHDSIAQGAFEEWWMRCLGSALRRVPRPVAMRA